MQLIPHRYVMGSVINIPPRLLLRGQLQGRPSCSLVRLLWLEKKRVTFLPGRVLKPPSPATDCLT